MNPSRVRRFNPTRRRAVRYGAPSFRRPSFYRSRFAQRSLASPVYRRKPGVYGKYGRKASYAYPRRSYPMRNVGYYAARQIAPYRPSYAAAALAFRRYPPSPYKPNYARRNAAGYRRGKKASTARRGRNTRRVASKRASKQGTNRSRSKGVKPPKREFSVGKYLMAWDNVSHNQFLKSLRQSYIQFGKLTPKQMKALQAAFAKRKSKRRLYPRVYRMGSEIDPIHLELLGLNEGDFQKIASSVGQSQSDLVKSLSDQLNGKGFLTYKQSRAAGSIIHQFRNPRHTEPTPPSTSN